MATLTYIEAGQPRFFPVGARDGAVTIGSSKSCTLQLKGENSKWVSRKHAKVECDENGAYVITVLSSTNKVCVNEEELHEGDAQELVAGDKIKIATFTLGWLIKKASRKGAPKAAAEKPAVSRSVSFAAPELAPIEETIVEAAESSTAPTPSIAATVRCKRARAAGASRVATPLNCFNHPHPHSRSANAQLPQIGTRGPLMKSAVLWAFGKHQFLRIQTARRAAKAAESDAHAAQVTQASRTLQRAWQGACSRRTAAVAAAKATAAAELAAAELVAAQLVQAQTGAAITIACAYRRFAAIAVFTDLMAEYEDAAFAAVKIQVQFRIRTAKAVLAMRAAQRATERAAALAAELAVTRAAEEVAAKERAAKERAAASAYEAAAKLAAARAEAARGAATALCSLHIAKQACETRAAQLECAAAHEHERATTFGAAATAFHRLAAAKESCDAHRAVRVERERVARAAAMAAVAVAKELAAQLAAGVIVAAAAAVHAASVTAAAEAAALQAAQEEAARCAAEQAQAVIAAAAITAAAELAAAEAAAFEAATLEAAAAAEAAAAVAAAAVKAAAVEAAAREAAALEAVAAAEVAAEAAAAEVAAEAIAAEVAAEAAAAEVAAEAAAAEAAAEAAAAEVAAEATAAIAEEATSPWLGCRVEALVEGEWLLATVVKGESGPGVLLLEYDNGDESEEVELPDDTVRSPEWGSYRVAELKEELTARALSTKGRKADLVKRLCADDAAAALE